MNSEYWSSCLEEGEKYSLDKTQLVKIVRKLNESFDYGLSKNPEDWKKTSVKMYVTHLGVIPNGTEEGRFFAIDLGGTKLRFFEMEVSKHVVNSRAEFYTVPQEAMHGTKAELFEFVAKSIKMGLEKFNFLDVEIPLFGFTFSFPCLQNALNSGTLVRWTKGYNTAGVVGEDVAKLLKIECDKIHLKIKDFALINDTTGSLLCGAFEDKDTCIGIINGTGTNACYIEDIHKVHKYSGTTSTNKMLINTEWGAFGELGELDDILTKMDNEIDKASINPKQQLYEKTMSGMYVGELVRLSLINLKEKSSFFKAGFPAGLLNAHAFTANLLSESYNKVEFIANFKELYNYCLSDQEFEAIAHICDCVTLRSAKLTAAGLVAIVKRVDAKRCAIAGDGSLFRKHPRFCQYVEKTMKELIDTSQIFEILLVDDGSGKGAAFAACVAK